VATLDPAALAEIDDALRTWRQGDCALGAAWFVFRIAPDAPLTPDATSAAAERMDNAETEVPGFCVITQTCDLVRRCSERPFAEVCPLILVEDPILRDIKSCRRPNFAFIAGLEERRLVADLDRVMTVEKAVLARWQRTAGCHSDDDARRLALALSRKRARVAFPDDFVSLARPLKDRLTSKHDKASEEGRALRALREIRVRAAPSWDADEVELMFWFIRHQDEPNFEGVPWHQMLERWLDVIQPHDRFPSIDGVVHTLDDLSAREFVESDPLDLDNLSARSSSTHQGR
jgi:hypothetical protein